MAKNEAQAENDTKAKESLAKKIWLAGLGAYGRGFDEALDQYKQLNEKSSKVFSELVEKGTELESLTRSKLEETKTQSTEAFESSVKQVRSKLGLSQSEESAKLEDLSDKVDALTKMVEKLATTKTSSTAKK